MSSDLELSIASAKLSLPNHTLGYILLRAAELHGTQLDLLSDSELAGSIAEYVRWKSKKR